MKHAKLIAAILAGTTAAAVLAGCGSPSLADLNNLAEGANKEVQAELEKYLSSEAAASETSSAVYYDYKGFDPASRSEESSSGGDTSSGIFANASSESYSSSPSSAYTSSTVSQASSSQTVSSYTSGTYVLPESNSRYYSREEIAGMSDYQLLIARNEIYARHGRKFHDSALQAYFNSQSWYHGTVDPDSFSTSVFNSYERSNVDTIVNEENSRG